MWHLWENVAADARVPENHVTGDLFSAGMPGGEEQKETDVGETISSMTDWM